VVPVPRAAEAPSRTRHEKERGGGYLTRNRAELIERELAEFRGYVDARLDRIERELARVAGLPLELVRAQSAAVLQAFHEVRGVTAELVAELAPSNGNGAAPTTTSKRRT
jgi:hypothetical protein